MHAHNFIDLTGKRYGRFFVVKLAPRKSGRNLVWICRCDCGRETDVVGSNLKSGSSKSCGCAGFDASAKTRKTGDGSRRTHGHYGSPTYKTWTAMLARCRNPNRDNFHQYGGRGIKVCSRWEKFDNFIQDMGVRPRGKTLERKDVNGDYSLSNCEWSTWQDQAKNRRNSVA